MRPEIRVLYLATYLSLVHHTSSWLTLSPRTSCAWHVQNTAQEHWIQQLQQFSSRIPVSAPPDKCHPTPALSRCVRSTVLLMAQDDHSSPDADSRDLKQWEVLQRKTLRAVEGIFSGGQAMKNLREWMMETTGLGHKEGEESEGEAVEVEVMDKDLFSKALHEAGVDTLNSRDIEDVFAAIDNDRDGSLTMEEMRDAYLRVHAEVFEEEEEVGQVEEEGSEFSGHAAGAQKLLPSAPGVEVDNAIPFPTDEPAAPDLLSRQWAQVCEVLRGQSEYLSAEEQQRVELAVRFAGERLVGAGAVGEEFGQGLGLAGVVAGLRAAGPAVVAAVLLPCVTADAASLEEVREAFGPVVVSILQDVIWLRSVPEQAGLLDDDSSRVLREYMVAATRDHRAVIVLLADRIQGLRKLEEAPVYEQHLRALESLQVFSPLAHALGVGKLLWELEDLSFRRLFPDSYLAVEEWQLALWAESDAMMERAKLDVLRALNHNTYLVKVVERYAISSRRKSVFSTFKKMFRANKRRDQVHDIFALRVVIGLRAEFRGEAAEQARVCVEGYGAVREGLAGWTEPTGRFKDYATHPKPNGYQSVHTTMVSPDGLPLEIQLRTEEMHAAAEFGDAAHSLYKGGIKSLSAAQQFAAAVQRDHSRVLHDDPPPETQSSSWTEEEEEGEDEVTEQDASSSEEEEEDEEEGSEVVAGGRRVGVLGAEELEGLILTAPAVAPEAAEEDEATWSSQEIGESLIFHRQHSQGEASSSVQSSAACEAHVWAGAESSLPLPLAMRALSADAWTDARAAGAAVKEGASELAVLRQVGASMVKRQERLRALLDAESARLFDPGAAVLEADLPPQLGPLGAGTVSLVRGDKKR